MTGRPTTILLLLAAFPLSGCAVGPWGTLAARRTLTPTADVLDVYAVGALLRPHGPDAGCSFGWRHVTYVYPREPDDGNSVGTFWTFGWAPFRQQVPFFLAARGIGAEVTLYPRFIRAHVGYAEDAFTFAGRVDETRTVCFRYRPRFPMATHLTMNPPPRCTAR